MTRFSARRLIGAVATRPVETLAFVCSAAGVSWAAVRLLDPSLHRGAVAAPALALTGAGLAALPRGGGRGHLLAACLALLFSVQAQVAPEFRADSAGYYAYLRSIVIDHDLDFTNDFERLVGEASELRKAPPTAIGRRPNPFAIGSAILWSPFFLLAHAYVLGLSAVGWTKHAADGFSDPYLRSTAMGTMTWAALAATLLMATLARRIGPAAAAVAVLGAIVTSPILYYVFVVPAMAHGLVFATAAILVWSLARAHARPTAGRWLSVGVVAGLLVLVRWQAAVCLAMVLAVGLVDLRRRRIPARWLAAALGAAALLASLQLLAWKLLYGALLTMPQGGQFMDWRCPRWWDVLMHADRGFFVWTPVMGIAIASLVVFAGDWGALGMGAVVVFILTVYVNGSVTDWAGADSFGSRRFDLVVPLAALGLASLVRRHRRAPLVLPVLLVAAAALWNTGLIRLYRQRVVQEALPLERVASAQAHQLRSAAERAGAAVAPDRGRALVYKSLVGEYFYWNVNLSGTIDLASEDTRYLAGGWSSLRCGNHPWPRYRWALFPRACVRFPLERALQDLRTTVSMRAPGRARGQEMTVELNGFTILRAPLPSEWTEVRFVMPQRALRPGENQLCLAFSEGVAGEEDRLVAAAVSVIQLP